MSPRGKWQPDELGRDPAPYDGPIARADGCKPFNRYLWPLPADDFWANRDLDWRISGRFHFSVVALNDGRWSTSGHLHDIEPGHAWGRPDRRTVFSTREAAVRAAAARFIRLARAARRWGGGDGLDEARAQELVNWALGIARRPPQPLRALPKAAPKTGLALFDWQRGVR